MSFWFTLSFLTTIAAPIKINYTFINDFIKRAGARARILVNTSCNQKGDSQIKNIKFVKAIK